jgi:IPT/TIG domain-containing protein
MMRRALLVAVLLGGRLAGAQVDPDEHGHGHRHKHPHPPDPHHHHPHAHPHPPGVGHHHPFDVEPIAPAAPVPAAPTSPTPPPPPSPPELRDFHPRRGPPGTRVTLSGVRFGDDARVLYNGRKLETHVEGHSILVVRLPPGAKSDVFVVRQKDAAEMRSAESFIVEPAPVIASLSPEAAAPGSTVDLRGRNFLPGDRVLFGDLPAQILSASPDRIEVVVPEGAADCRPAVVRDEALASARRAFRVLAPQPVISGVQPPTGAPGTTVRILGKNFLPDDRALLGKTPMAIVARGPEFLDATVPPAPSGGIRVVGKGRQARAETGFTVIQPPVVTGIEPAWATPGAGATVHGRNFVAGDVVMVGDKPARDVTVTASQISFTVPDDAQTAPVSVLRGGARAATRAALEVVRPPVLGSFEPPAGPAGTRVVLRGENLGSDANVRYGATEIRPLLRRPPGEIDVRIPRGATGERFVVTTRGGQATSDKAFEIREPAAIASFEPAFGAAGTQVVIHGRGFSPGDTVSLGGVNLPVQSASPDALTVVVPPGARPAPFVVESRGVKLASRHSFRLVAPPPAAVLVFAPLSGPPGTEVVLRTGRRLTAADRVLLDGNPLPKILAAEGAEARVRVPAGAHTGRFAVETAGGERVVADQPFQVVEKSAPVTNSPGVY